MKNRKKERQRKVKVLGENVTFTVSLKVREGKQSWGPMGDGIPKSGSLALKYYLSIPY